VYNCALDDKGNLKYFDLDGIKLFNSQEEMVASEDYKNIIGHLMRIGKHWEMLKFIVQPNKLMYKNNYGK
jgi:hypothetical protein